ncbi:MAG TPA: DMT family transporter [Coriobacteriia bacterium]|nr:DMT family transporter [Coriobacteriia bacterium]
MPAAASYRGGLARIAAAGLVWGSIALFSRQVGAAAVVIVFWRVTFAGLAIAAYLALRGRLGELVRLPTRRKLALAAMGSLLALNWVLFFSALKLTDVAVAVLLAYCGPIFVMAFAPLVTREPFDRRVVVPLVAALAGTAIIVGPRELQLAEGTHLLGATLAFASAFTYAILVLNAKRLLRGIPTTIYMLGEDITAALVLLPLVIMTPGPSTAVEWGSLVTLGVVHTAATGVLFLSALRTVRADHAAVLTYAEPVSAVVFAAIFLREPITPATVIGGLMVVLAGMRVARMGPAPGIETPGPMLDAETV